MDALVKALEKFIMRDLAFIVGGSSIMMSFLFVYGRLPTASMPVIFYLLGAAFAYAIGWAIQDSLTFPRLTRTKAGHNPTWLGKRLYSLFDRKCAIPVDSKKYEAAKRWLYESAPQRFRDDHERTESLKQVGMTLGPCFVISGMILFGKNWLLLIDFEQSVTVTVLLLGLLLWLLGWLKVTQQAQYLLAKAPNNSPV